MTAAPSRTSARSFLRMSPVNLSSAEGSKRRNRRTSSPVRTGWASLGPSLLKSTRAPIACTGTRMSEKNTTPSGENRRNGCRETSAARSASRHSSRKETRRRTSRYSGRYRPACRIIHAGGRSTGRPKQASRNRFAEEESIVSSCTARQYNERPTGLGGSGDQVSQDVGQDPAVPVVVRFDGRIDARAQGNFLDAAIRTSDREF